MDKIDEIARAKYSNLFGFICANYDKSNRGDRVTLIRAKYLTIFSDLWHEKISGQRITSIEYYRNASEDVSVLHEPMIEYVIASAYQELGILDILKIENGDGERLLIKARKKDYPFFNLLPEEEITARDILETCSTHLLDHLKSDVFQLLYESECMDQRRQEEALYNDKIMLDIFDKGEEAYAS